MLSRKQILTTLAAGLAGGAAFVATPRAVHAQDIEVPILVMEAPETDTGESDEQLDLANVVQTAAKGVTTVQEAPAIVTVIPGDELRQMAPGMLTELLDVVPGWSRANAEHGTFPLSIARGVPQGALYLRDGVGMFDSMFAVATNGPQVPLENIKRVEIVTGPGGVLWGANSFMGVVNIITKDAEDVDGVEASIGYGDGPGNKGRYRGYVMAGIPKLFGHDNVKLFLHTSYDSYIGYTFKDTTHLFSQPLPLPNSADLWGPITSADPARSYMFNFDGKLTLGSVNLYWQVPFAELHHEGTFPGTVTRPTLPQDTQVDPMTGMLLCPPVDPGSSDLLSHTNPCVDRNKVSRDDQVNWFERYVIADWHTRFADSKAGLSVKGYFIQMERPWNVLNILPPVKGLLEGGLTFTADPTIYRYGGSIDGDIDMPNHVRLLYGGEAFHEWLPDNTTRSREGAGTEVTFLGPYDLTRLPLPCPHTATWDGTNPQMVTLEHGCPLTFAFAADRTVLGAFTSAQWRPSKRLILDGGVRAQVAPGALGRATYSPTLLFGGAAVYEFIPDWHLKLNYSQGFRPPAFNNAYSNGQAVEIDGRADLKVEKSDSFQTEVNARVLKNHRRIRELDMRADYSYSTVDGFITFVGGRYENTAPRGIHSVEFLAKLYLKGDHRVELGYTFLHTNMEDKGIYKASPNNYFNVGAYMTLIPGKLEVGSLLRVYGAFEDPNRRIEARNLSYPMDGVANPSCLAGQCTDPSVVQVQPSEVVLDRIPSAADLQLSVRYKMMNNRLLLTATTYNTFNALYYQQDPFHDYSPRLEFAPVQFEEFRFFTSATYNY